MMAKLKIQSAEVEFMEGMKTRDQYLIGGEEREERKEELLATHAADIESSRVTPLLTSPGNQNASNREMRNILAKIKRFLGKQVE